MKKKWGVFLYRKRLKEIEEDLAYNHQHKTLMDLMAVTLGLATVKALSSGMYLSIIGDVVCILLAGIVVSMADEENKELLLEKTSIQEMEKQIEQ